MGFEPTPVSKSQELGFGEARIIRKEKRALNPCCQQKSRQRRHASENDIQELCRENVRCPKFQGYMFRVLGLGFWV